jgi:EAL domain-containing protein (putative c-di-GMP-specific phosphodiesterase class I)
MALHSTYLTPPSPRRCVSTTTAKLRARTCRLVCPALLFSSSVRLAIDDFGTGYSSLSYLRQFPVDILKIDRSFINTITDRTKIPAIVRGLLDLGRTLELETVAEGVEDDIQLDSLRDENCELAQGYLFARPLEPIDAEALLAQIGGVPSVLPH